MKPHSPGRGGIGVSLFFSLAADVARPGERSAGAAGGAGPAKLPAALKTAGAPVHVTELRVAHPPATIGVCRGIQAPGARDAPLGEGDKITVGPKAAQPQKER